ncbi:MAG: cysteine desulfurase NifS [bacterium]|nr:cysteine desulfurase NifS [bacterium]
MKFVYLDHNATSPTRAEAVKEMMPYFTKIYGNASSIHSFGRDAKRALEESRTKVAVSLGVLDPKEIIFTSGGTESDNLAIKGVAYKNQKKGNHIITTQIEHHAVLNCCKFLEKDGFETTYLPVNEFGEVDPDNLKKSIRKNTILISIMHANNEIGTIEPISEIGKIAKENGVLFHTDAVQSIGKIPVNLNEMNIDLLSLSGHKFYGPKGVGALYIRKGTNIGALQHGGHHEKNHRAGTENIPGIVGLAKALELNINEIQSENQRLTSLREKLWKGLSDSIPEIVRNGSVKNCLPNTLNICIKYIEGESMLLSLDNVGIAISTGSACTSASLEPSHVLLAIGRSPEMAHGSIRFSSGKYTTDEDINYVIDNLPPIVDRLRKMSPLYVHK